MRLYVIIFIRLHYWLNCRGIKIHGLGYVQRFLRKEFVFNAFGSKFLYAPPIEGSYDYLLIGKSNEPETQLFFSKVFPALKSANFIDVGASVGEFVMSACKYTNVKKVFAFEPRPECALVLRKNAELNEEKRIVAFQNAASDSAGSVTFHRNPGGTSSGLFGNSNSGRGQNVNAIALDSVLPETMENTVMLVDVEGAEPLVLKGGLRFIQKNSPLIIFEYNQTSKQHFDLAEISALLGQNYDIYRLKGDGNLDIDFTNSWNCVAVPRNSVFREILRPSIKIQD